MAPTELAGELDVRYGSEGATAVAWSRVDEELRSAQIFWLSTVRPSGQPHVTPLLSVWMDGSAFVCTGTEEQKAANLATNPHCTLTTGRPTWEATVDVVLEGQAVRVVDDDRLVQINDAYEAKYGPEWRYEVRDAAFHHAGGSVRDDDPGAVLVFEIAPAKVLTFERGDRFSQTRWRF
jgi:nitroimidazol reductase NimA-like FMN-containing flavoprotein (pyridoxamine 5'-phosphate oxidase superfamily)